MSYLLIHKASLTVADTPLMRHQHVDGQPVPPAAVPPVLLLLPVTVVRVVDVERRYLLEARRHPRLHAEQTVFGRLVGQLYRRQPHGGGGGGGGRCCCWWCCCRLYCCRLCCCIRLRCCCCCCCWRVVNDTGNRGRSNVSTTTSVCSSTYSNDFGSPSVRATTTPSVCVVPATRKSRSDRRTYMYTSRACPKRARGPSPPKSGKK